MPILLENMETKKGKAKLACVGIILRVTFNVCLKAL